MRDQDNDTNPPLVRDAEEGPEAFRLLLATLPQGAPADWKLTAARRKQLIERLKAAIRTAHALLGTLDPAEQVITTVDLISQLPVADAGSWSLSSPRRKYLREIIDSTTGELQALSIALDPIKRPPAVFDPSDPQQMAQLI